LKRRLPQEASDDDARQAWQHGSAIALARQPTKTLAFDTASPQVCQWFRINGKVSIKMTVLTREDAMDHRSPILGLIVLCLCTAAPAVAQDKRALIEKLMEVSNISGQLQSGVQSVTVQIMTQIKKNNPTIPEDVSIYVQGKIENKFSRILSTIVNQLGYQVYSETFSVDELQSVINFYRSEAGQKLVQKSPILIQNIATRLPEYLKEVGPKIRETAIAAAAEKKYHLEF
jgi:uncharacterized protein